MVLSCSQLFALLSVLSEQSLPIHGVRPNPSFHTDALRLAAPAFARG